MTSSSPSPYEESRTGRIRRYNAADLGALYSICLRTGDAGRDATHLHDDRMLRGHVYAAPYAVLEPELCFVAADEHHLGGYIVGALHTASFDARAESEWWPPLRDRYAEPDHAGRSAWSADEWMAYLIHHPVMGDAAIVDDYPSHLHINLLPRFQGRGLGRRLMDTLLATLKAGGSHGVHLGVAATNENAIGFYEHIGFKRLSANPAHLVYAYEL